MDVTTLTRRARKIDPTTRPPANLKPDGSPDDNDRVETGPTDLAFSEWAARGLTPPNLARMRRTRLDRVCAELQRRDYAGVLLFDPLSIRYATDSSNMQVWTTHNLARAAFIAANGHVTLWDFHGSRHLSSYLPLIKDVRHGAGFFYFLSGDATARKAQAFAAQIDDLTRLHGGANRRVAVDKIEIAGLRALVALGLEVMDGQEVMDHARLIKGEDEVNAMKCAVATTEIAMAAMREELRPGVAEVELWSVLHVENIKRGGEWIETRILSSGPRTNPWMQEAGPRKIRAGDLLAFDTDLIGPYGMCADLSRTWFCGDGRPSDKQRRLFADAHDHIMTNRQLLKPGVAFRELTETGQKLPDAYREQRYGVMMHGVGMCDEFPAIYYPDDYIEGAFDYVLRPGMTLCVEVYFGEVGGRDGVKLEDQVVITEDGHELLSHYPFDPLLLG